MLRLMNDIVNFPNLAILFGTIAIIYGTFKGSETTVQVGGSIVGIGGTAYQVAAKHKFGKNDLDEDEGYDTDPNENI